MPVARRPLADLSSLDFDRHETDVLVIGGGVAGFSAAIAAAQGARVLCVTKDSALSSNTWAAQGGVAAVLSDEDSVESHRDDTLSAGVGLCDEVAVELVVREGPERVRDLISWGGSFDREEEGELHLTLEGGHSRKRVLHAQGDQTGVEVQKTLLRKVKSFANIELREHVFAVDLVVEAGHCVGALLWHQGRYTLVRARATVLATGGAGQLYRETTNPIIATGDGFAMALRAGAVLRDMEFIQFHPTTLYVAGSARHLITEAVRGEGGILRDMRGERFMVHYHPMAELAPRDVVARSIVRQMKMYGDSHVYLDLSHLDPVFVRERFPNLAEICKLFKIDVASDMIPIHPSVHYVMGGVVADMDGRTSVPGLLACGEVASSGLHGANRLASNSLLEGLVFGQRSGLAAAAAEGAPLKTPSIFPETDFGLEGSVINAADMFNSIKSLMWKDVGIVRSAEMLERAVTRLGNWSDYVFQCRFHSAQGWELVNSLTVAHAVATSALWREESRGAHFRSDFPETDDRNWRRHSRLPREDETELAQD